MFSNGLLTIEQFLKLERVKVFGFLQPSEASEILLRSLAFVLPGRDDNWGTVIAEAAASGCILLTTKNVGAAYDFLEELKNGYLLDIRSSKSLSNILLKIENMDSKILLNMSKASVIKSLDFDSNRLTSAIEKLYGNLS